MEIEKADLVKGLEAYKTIEANLNKEIARESYLLSKVEDANPDAVEIRKDINETITDLKASIVENTKDAADAKVMVDTACKELDTQIKDQNDKITLIENGETKVSLEELNQLTDVLMLDVTKTAALASVKDLLA